MDEHTAAQLLERAGQVLGRGAALHARTAALWAEVEGTILHITLTRQELRDALSAFHERYAQSRAQFIERLAQLFPAANQDRHS